MIDFRAGHLQFRVGKDDGNLLSATFDILLGKMAEVYIGLQCGIHRDSDATFAHRNGEVEVLAHDRTLYRHLVFVCHNLMDLIFRGVES